MKKRIVIGVTGSISAYKSAELASALVKEGYDVHVIMTENAAKFITPLTMETITKNKVYVDMFKDEDHTKVTHIWMATECDLVLVAPASYSIIGKAANGIADDLLSSVIAAACPSKIIFAPAMNVNMYNNPINQRNINNLKELGATFIEPEEGMLACGVKAKGRLRNIPEIVEYVNAYFTPKLLKGKKILITAGATREHIDPIRFLSNTSSGLMGVSLAKVCRDMGADVTLIIANSQYDVTNVKVSKVSTVSEMYEECSSRFEHCDIFISCAAVSDFKPVSYSSSKIKKTSESLTLELVKNIDILYEMGKRKAKQKLIGFAAESEDLFINAKTKLKNKNLDAIVANELSNFSNDVGKVWVLGEEYCVELEQKPKIELAYDIISVLLDNNVI